LGSGCPGTVGEMNADHREGLNIDPDEAVKVSFRRGEIGIKALASEWVEVESVFIPFYFVETAANMLTNEAGEPTAKIPGLKVAACKVAKVNKTK
jgi:predicted molibdopterin-dependent oxidoreductase YjgC